MVGLRVNILVLLPSPGLDGVRRQKKLGNNGLLPDGCVVEEKLAGILKARNNQDLRLD